MFSNFGQDILESETERIRQRNLIELPSQQAKQTGKGELLDDGRVGAFDSIGVQCSGTMPRYGFTGFEHLIVGNYQDGN